MKYLGLDVHSKATVWCLLDAAGEVSERGKVSTTAGALTGLVERLGNEDRITAGQEIGRMSYFVHDVLTAAGVKLLSFNSHRLRMIASSRKKTDKRDAYWIARALQTGMMPHPVYIPTGEVRELRGLLATRAALVADRTRWGVRGRAAVMAAGNGTKRSRRGPWLEQVLDNVDGIDAYLGERLELSERMYHRASAELSELDAKIRERAKDIEAVRRLQTIPGVGEKVAVTIYAWVGDVTRFPNARALASYAGLVPSVRQSADRAVYGPTTREGSRQLRAILVQAGHVLLWKCSSDEAAPLRALPQRVHTSRGRRKLAVVAAARQILKVAYYVLRDGTSYDPTKLRLPPQVPQALRATG